MDDLDTLILQNVTPLNPWVVYRFGSARDGLDGTRPDSDVDVALWGLREWNALVLFEAAQRIARPLRRDVDLVDLRTADDVFRAHVVGGGRRLQVDPEHRREVDEFEMRALKSYAYLNEERAEVLRAEGIVL